jgi:two-component system NtrC family sensor kinase
MQDQEIGGRDRVQRVLVIDDNPGIHQDFRKILVRHDTVLDEFEAELFGEGGAATEQYTFEVDSALQGEEGLEKVKRAVRENRPYGVAFVDLRMPPGWDGLETITRIWQVDARMQIVLCAAHLTYTWEEIVAKLKRADGLAILKKPFETVEVTQLATNLTDNWRLLTESRPDLQSQA